MGKFTSHQEQTRKLAREIVRDPSKPVATRYQALKVLARVVKRAEMIGYLLRAIPTLDDPRVQRLCLAWYERLQEQEAVVAAARAKIAAEKAARIPEVVDAAAAAPTKPVERAAIPLVASAPPVLPDNSDPLTVLAAAQEPPEGTTAAESVPVQGPTPTAASVEAREVSSLPAARPDDWAPLFAAEMARAGVVKGYDRDWIPILRRVPNPEAVLEKLKGLRGHGDVEDFVKLVKRRLDAPKPVAKPTAVLMPLVNPTPQQQASWEVDRLHPLDKNTKTYRDFQSRVYRLMDSPENRRNPRAVLVQLAEIHSTTELNAFLNARNCP